MEALNARKMETDENSSGALGAGENGGGSYIAVRRYLAAAAAVKLGGGLSAVGPRASWCGYGDALWKKHRAGRARVHRGTHGFVCWESMNLIDHGRNLRASLPSVRAIGDPLYPFCHFY